MFGFLNVDKPVGVTSHDVVGAARRALKTKRVGHAGTLDPLASGVLVLLVGPATRLSDEVMHATKEYEARMLLGVETATDDAEGEVTARRDASGITRGQVEAALPAFTGDLLQVPPMYSAIKQGGRKLYALARAGQTVERAARPVTIHRLELTDWTPPEFSLRVVCGAGTYIRSLARDLGAALGVGGSLVGLRRTASGRFRVEDAISLETLRADPDPARFLIPPREALSDRPALVLDADAVRELGFGRTIPAPDAADGEVAFGYAAGGELVAVLRADGGRWKPQKVFLA